LDAPCWPKFPGSVSLAVEWNGSVKAQPFATEAKKRGIAVDRIVFAPLVSFQEHLCRVHLADVFWIRCHATPIRRQAMPLWCGVPVLTCLGSTFCRRVAASL